MYSKILRRWRGGALAGLCLALAAGSGCQTWVAGMTLPSGHYLDHPPQYFPPSPPFPLSRELASMEAANAAALGVAVPPVVAPLPQAVPGAVPVPPVGVPPGGMPPGGMP